MQHLFLGSLVSTFLAFPDEYPFAGWADTAVEWLIAAKCNVDKRNTAGFAPVPYNPTLVALLSSSHPAKCDVDKRNTAGFAPVPSSSLLLSSLELNHTKVYQP